MVATMVQLQQGVGVGAKTRALRADEKDALHRQPKVKCWNCGGVIAIGSLSHVPASGELFIVRCFRPECRAYNCLGMEG